MANWSGTLSLLNSILAYAGTSSNAFGTLTDAGHNISSDGSANFESGTSFNFTDPLLLPLANYGGPTMTMALSSGSPAIGFGTSTGAPMIDQRGVLRPSGPDTDIGAYEYQAGLFIPTLSISLQQQLVYLTFTGQANVSYHLQGSYTLSGWTNIEEIGPLPNDGPVTRTLDANPQGNEFFRLSIP